MIDLDQKVIVRWNPMTRKHFEDLGYVYTEHNDKFSVLARHLPAGSGVKINAKCDYCGDDICMPYGVYLIKTNNHSNKCACRKCASLKTFEYGEKRRLLYNDFINICSNFNMTPVTTFEEFASRNQLLKFICPKHGL